MQLRVLKAMHRKMHRGAALSTALLLALLMAVVAAQSSVSNAAEPTIVVVGDSLSSGYGLAGSPSWVDLLSERLEEQGYGYDVVNASISGDTTSGGLSRLPRLLESHEPRFVVIELGGNDGLRGQPVTLLRDNLAGMIELAVNSGAEVLLAGIRIPPNYGPAYTQSFEGVYSELADEHSLALVEFFMDGVALEDRYMQRDGIHPNAQAQSLLLENVWTVLAAQLN